MNLINIACNDLKNFLIQKKYIFFILIIGLIVASYSFSFFTAQSLHIMELINDYFNYSTKYYISGNGNILDYKKINYILILIQIRFIILNLMVLKKLLLAYLTLHLKMQEFQKFMPNKELKKTDQLLKSSLLRVLII